MGDLLAILDLAYGGGEEMSEKVEKAQAALIKEHGKIVRLPYAPTNSDDYRLDLRIAAFESAIREEALSEADRLIVRTALRCPKHGTDHFCDLFGCHSLDELSDSIRALEEKP